MKKLILCDLDGTLLKDDSTISDETISYIKELKTKHYFSIITSSDIQKTLPFYNLLELDTHMVCNNGGIIFNPKTNDLHSQEIEKTDILSYFNDLEDKIISIFYKNKNAYSYNFIDRYKFIMQIPSDMNLFNDNFNNLSLENTTNFYLISKPENEDFIYNYFKDKDLNLDCIGKDKKIIILNISHKKVLKEESINFFKNNYSFTEIISFGDSKFDINMLKKSDTSFLMKNSFVNDDSLTKTEYSNNEDGVIKELKKLNI